MPDDQQAVLDCPLRDAPFSIDLPLIDVLTSDAARKVVHATLPQVLELPEFMLRTEAPAFGAIVTLRQVAEMSGAEAADVEKVDAQLNVLALTDADRRARCARYDNDRPDMVVPGDGTRILVFHKINGFDHGPSVGAATAAIRELAAAPGWFVAATDKGGAFTKEFLSQFDAVVWNNVSGDVLTLSQRKAFRDYIESGGGFLGLHGSGGDSIWFWDWYRDELLGAQFIGHPMQPQFQDAQVMIEPHADGIGEALAPGWIMNDEWYSFAASPRSTGAQVVATLDESTYDLTSSFDGEDLHMGDDHPVVWTRCVGEGRAFYSAIGHRPEVYDVTQYRTLLLEGLAWATGQSESACGGGS